MLDNSELIAPFCPPKEDGDTFIYTEMLDRGKRKGNNGQRLLKTFYHRSRDEFWEQLPTIKKLCDMAEVRACTRLAPKSFKSVAKTFLRLVTETYVTENYAGMKSIYNRACGITSPITKLWLWDVDAITPEALQLKDALVDLNVFFSAIPSKKGIHYITKPFDIRTLPDGVLQAAQGQKLPNGDFGNCHVHKDNPTNLYIPDGAV